MWRNARVRELCKLNTTPTRQGYGKSHILSPTGRELKVLRKEFKQKVTKNLMNKRIIQEVNANSQLICGAVV